MTILELLRVQIAGMKSIMQNCTQYDAKTETRLGPLQVRDSLEPTGIARPIAVNRPTPDWKPRIAIGALVLVHLLGNFVSVPIYLASLQENITLLIAVALILIGAGLTQVVLLAIWAARGVEAWVVRYARSLFLTALGTLALLIGFRLELETGGAFIELLIIVETNAVPVFIIFSASCLIAHIQNVWTKRRLDRCESVDKSPILAASQFSLLRLFLWTAGVGLLLGLSRLVAPIVGGGDAFLNKVFDLYQGLFTAAIIGIPLLLVAFPTASFLLDDRPRSSGYLALKCVVLTGSFFLGECLLMGTLLFVYSETSIEEFSQYIGRVMVWIGCFNLGILIESSLVLGVVRRCGFRLVRLPLAVNSPIDRTIGSG